MDPLVVVVFIIAFVVLAFAVSFALWNAGKSGESERYIEDNTDEGDEE